MPTFIENMEFKMFDIFSWLDWDLCFGRIPQRQIAIFIMSYQGYTLSKLLITAINHEYTAEEVFIILSTLKLPFPPFHDALFGKKSLCTVYTQSVESHTLLH